MKRILLATLLLASGAALAADNATLITPCASSCVTMRARDVGSGVQSMIQILGDTSGNPIYGTAGTANANILTVQGIASMTPLLATVTNGGTFATQATQAGTWTVQPGNTANTTAWLVTGTGGTFPAVLAAETTKVIGTVNVAAAQTIAVTNAGTFATQATQAGTWTVTGAGGTFPAVLGAETTKVIGTVRNLGNAGAVLDAAGQNATAPANSLQVGGQFNTTPTTITSGNFSPLQLDSGGRLIVNVGAGGGSGGTSSSFAAAFPATGTAVGMSQGGNMVALTGTSNNLNVQCANCSGSGASAVDAATFTASTSVFAPGGGFFQTTATANALTNGQQGMWQMTANRAGFVNLRNAAGTEVGTTTTPLSTNLAMMAGTAITAVPSAYGTAPTGNVIGANVFVTNTNANGQATAANSSPVVLPTAQVSIGTAGTASTNVVTVQGIASMTKLLVTPDSVALPANQSVNVAQINGVTTLMGNGVTGTGSQRVTIASDNTAFAVNSTLTAETTKVIGTVRNLGNAGAVFDAATGAAPAANAVQIGFLTSGATGGLLALPIACDQSALLNMTTATTTEIVALTSGRQIHVCSYSITTNGTTAVKFVQGTGTNCATGQSDKTANDEWTAQTGMTRGSGLGKLFSTTSANALCVTNGSAINAHINVSYAVL